MVGTKRDLVTNSSVGVLCGGQTVKALGGGKENCFSVETKKENTKVKENISGQLWEADSEI